MQCALTAWNWLRIAVAVFSVSVAAGQTNPTAPPTEPPVQNQNESNITPPMPPIEPLTPEWFDGPPRKDFAWDVRVTPAILTFRQRQLVRIEAAFRGGALSKAGLLSGDLFIVLKLGVKDGPWLPGFSVRTFDIPTKLASRSEVHALFGLYAEPGTYRASLLAYERRTGKRNLWHGVLRVPNIVRDPLPGDDPVGPAIEFLPAAPPTTSGRGWVLSHDPWDFEHGRQTIPVANDAPVEVDVVANLSLSDTANSRRAEAPDWMYQFNAAVVTEISYVLSEFGVKNGCTRLSALDIPRQEVLADFEDTRTFDWSWIHTALQNRSRDKIDVHTLANAKKTPSFLASYLARLASDPRRCAGQEGRTPVRILIVVSDAFVFPYRTEMRQAQPSAAWASSYYLELVPMFGPRWDEMRNVLKPLNPVRMEVANPDGFRRILVQLIHEIERISRSKAVPPH